ncbi:MAG: hypothetical protein ACD_32C00145G0012 [uncultured bacterium]|uniref:Uncharacterized protein n=1 Tax=Candidatus Daviesbacteria bacterium GW2011_GWC2_40_12 TaxID=1618431 RepID=A0A0G0T0X7_9BACT|nr:MAG: hypothetical protein ACD_32C00145G0012 [uncultured bacterium]KKQ81087.1 MAG: hypothetical protein UT04_C0084G0005 [Candidatus Daviesbacteria bacterium GW2011_GWF2_38_7]KKR24078.1 MAG: hypothetical protein UT54_C0031G0003 [Candidatus Daviesbacteria bacterium GW2011_GWB1_39_5]KKR40780.1 MAG: hypothetical protein UT77_C0019G0012 [Candidatus Daviesbacteria bacterium GW2011_GWC2_40_12]OGE22445.1 MAG: hypothetical protein A2778_00100 [Candidatus Daviesbacteria bacterium RIFCSPHIGHO2_01_FULL_4
MDFFSGIKAAIVGILTAVNIIVAPVLPSLPKIAPSSSPIASPSASVSAQSPSVTSAPAPIVGTSATPLSSPSSSGSPLPLTGDNYIWVRGTYSYVGQSIKYFFIIPSRGGGFSGSIEGACTATVGGEYAGGEGGKINGRASGKCNILFVKYQGEIGFKGNLYPSNKRIVIEIENANLKPITLYYN